jgi:hypothetical protein
MLKNVEYILSDFRVSNLELEFFVWFLTVNGKYINPMNELSNKIWKFENQSRLEKAQQWFDTRKSDNMYSTFLSIKQ